jgi:two-component system, OmpR family, sensor histidine kinase KdpD
MKNRTGGMMKDSLRRTLPYLLAILVIAVSLPLMIGLQALIHPSNAALALLFLLPVGLITSFWGLGPGIMSAFLAFLAFNYFFIPPYYSLLVHQTQDLLVLFVFLVVAVVISQLVGSIRRNLAEVTAREVEAIRLYELSTALAGTQKDDAIIQVIVERATETFHADRIEVYVKSRQDSARSPALLVTEDCQPVGNNPVDLPPDFSVPMQSAAGLLGEIRLWRKNEPLKSSEERLARTFASQAVLALERSHLSQAETRARVLEESDRLKSSLLSSVSHELRTPLATIKAAVTSLRSGEVEWDNEARADLLGAIEEETDHLNHLVGNLLNMSRIEAGVLRPELRWNVLAEIAASAAHRQRATQHTLDLDFSEDLPLVAVDWVQMEQVFTNLLSNSLKYAPAGSCIYVSGRVLDEAFLQVQVSNAGPQVPEDQLERIFDKFYRLTRADRVTGTGLGLSICKGIIEAHGGRIWAENRPDGFAFLFTLPLTWKGDSPHLPEESR